MISLPLSIIYSLYNNYTINNPKLNDDYINTTLVFEGKSSSDTHHLHSVEIRFPRACKHKRSRV